MSARRVRSKVSPIAAVRSSIRAPRPTSICLRYAEHLLASAIGTASSRLALSLLLRRRAVSTKAALRLLDDASAAIQHSRDLLQHAINYAEQGITVLDRDLRLLAWNQAFVDLYELPPNLVRVGVGMDSIIHFNASRGSYGEGDVAELVSARIHSFLHDLEPVRLRLHPSGKVIEIRSNQLPDGGLVTTYTDVTDTVAAEEESRRANETLEQRVRERTEQLTRLNEALTGARRPRQTRRTSPRRGFSPPPATTSCSRSMPRASMRVRSSSATRMRATRRSRKTSMRRSTRSRKSSPRCWISRASTPAP